MQPFQCDLQPQIPKQPLTTHTQPHPKQLQATVTQRQKKNDKPTAAATVAHTRYLSSWPAATLHGKTRFRAPASSPKHSPCNSMQPFQWDLQPQIPKHPITTHTHTTTPKAASSHRYTAAKKKQQSDRSRNRRTDEVPFIAGCSHFTRKTQGFVLQLPPQHKADATSCSHSNAICHHSFKKFIIASLLHPPCVTASSSFVMSCYVIYHPSSRSTG